MCKTGQESEEVRPPDELSVQTDEETEARDQCLLP